MLGDLGCRSDNNRFLGGQQIFPLGAWGSEQQYGGSGHGLSHLISMHSSTHLQVCEGVEPDRVGDGPVIPDGPACSMRAGLHRRWHAVGRDEAVGDAAECMKASRPSLWLPSFLPCSAARPHPAHPPVFACTAHRHRFPLPLRLAWNFIMTQYVYALCSRLAKAHAYI